MPGTIQPRTREDEPLSTPAAVPGAGAGLCSTCVNSPSCVYREARAKDALYCEMFDSGNGASDASTVTLFTAAKPEAGERADLKGLCVNCENRNGCNLIRAESGVWHCEEYR